MVYSQSRVADDDRVVAPGRSRVDIVGAYDDSSLCYSREHIQFQQMLPDKMGALFIHHRSPHMRCTDAEGPHYAVMTRTHCCSKRSSLSGLSHRYPDWAGHSGVAAMSTIVWVIEQSITQDRANFSSTRAG